jgi:PAS domain S-box-containing protein
MLNKEQKELENRISALEKENFLLKNKLDFYELFNESSNTWETFRDKNGKPIFVSPSVEHITGYSNESILNGENDFLDLVHPEDLETAKQNLQKQSDEQFISNIIIRILDTNKTVKYLSVSSKPVYNQDNEFIGTHTSCNDITELKQAEQSIKESENNYSLFFNTLKDFIWILDSTGEIVYVNDYVIKRLGYTREEMSHMNILLVHPPERRKEAFQIVTEMLEGKTEFCPIPIITKNGNYIPVETRVVKGLWNGRNVIYGISKDISDVKLSEEKFSKAFHNNANLMAISLFETGEYLDVNETFLNTFHLKREEVIGKTSVESLFLSREKRARLLKEIKQKNSINNIDLAIKVGGRTIYGLFSADIIYIQDKKCLLTVMQDITEIKQVENQLKELNATKDKLFSIIAHDLKNPFNTILGFSELLSENIRSYDIEKSEQFIEHINSAAKSTLNLLDNLLAWAKTQTGEMNIKPERLLLQPIIQEMVDVSTSSATIKGITINSFQSDHVAVLADQNMLQTILLNLISNAIKFTRSGGKVDIFTISDQNQIEITIKDTGIGMDDKTLNKLFKIESNFTTTGTAREKGTGLGLILCKGFVEKLGGKIWAKSKPGIGSEFHFTLPRI